jgi:hypothetical protein
MMRDCNMGQCDAPVFRLPATATPETGDVLPVIETRSTTQTHRCMFRRRVFAGHTEGFRVQIALLDQGGPRGLWGQRAAHTASRQSSA